MTDSVRTTRRDLMAGVAGLIVSQPLHAALNGGPAGKPEITSTAQAFRAAHGQVAAFFFGGWTQYGGPRNPAPWYWINHGYQGRLPTRSVPLPGHWLGWSFNERDAQYEPVGRSGSARVTDARISNGDGYMLFQPTGAQPAVRSPDFHAGMGASFPAIRFSVRRSGAKTWRCAITFSTRDDPSKTGRVEVPEPRWQDGPTVVTVDMTGNDDWMKGDIRNVSIELGMAGGGAYMLHDRFELLPSPALAQELAALQGLPQDQSWAADWQQTEAAAHGVDALLMCTFWDGEKSGNRSVVDAMFASNAAPTLKLGVYFDSLATRRPQSLADFDKLLSNWNGYFANRKFWRIDGKPVLGWHGGESSRDFLSSIPEFAGMTGNDRLAAMVRHVQEFYRSSPGSNARSGVYLVAGFMVDNPYWTGSAGGRAALWEQAGFDAGTVYNQFMSSSRQGSPPASGSGNMNRQAAAVGVQDFSQINEIYRDASDWITKRSGSRMRYFTPAIAGWDVRPWAVLNPRKSSPCAPTWGCTPSQAQFLEHLEGVRDRAMAAAPEFPSPPGPVVMINAWDEFGEGGFLCPTRSFGTSRLEAVRDTFGVSSG